MQFTMTNKWLSALRKPRLATRLLTWFLFLTIVPLGLIMWITYERGAAAIRREVEQSLEATSKARAVQIENYVVERKRNASGLSRIPDIVATMAEFHQAFQKGGLRSAEFEAIDLRMRAFLTSVKESRGYSDLFLISPDGDCLFSVTKAEVSGSNVITGPYRDSSLARVFERTKSMLDSEVSDFDYYQASNESAAFLAAPIMRGKTLVGIIELQLNNQDIYKLLADYTGLGETGETVVTSLRNDRLLFMAPTRHDPDAAFRRQIPMKELPKYRSLSESSQGRASTGAEVVTDYSNKQVLAVWRFLPSFRWGMVTKVNVEEATASISAMRRDQLVIAFFAVLVVIAAALYVARSISNPISKLTQTTNLIAAGNLNEKIEIGSEDEVGELAVAFNKMTADLRSTLVSRDALAEQFRHRELLTDAIRHVVSQLGTTSTDIMNATGKLSHGAREQAGAVKQTAATVDQVSQTAVQAANRARKVADSVRRSEEVGKAGHKAVGDTIQVLGVAKERSDKVAENIVALAEKTQAIGEIIATVSEIAEQTNLLSLNAAIEAARAGEHGRGFTVVAQEVKALAEQSKKATGQVRSILESIQKAISTAVYSTEQGIHSMATATQAASQAGETIRLLSEIITEAAAVSNQIMQTASQQTAGMESVGMAISSINQVTTQNLSSTAQTENAARELNRMGQKLTDLLKESNPIGG